MRACRVRCSEGSIGFLGTSNRVCVALSRAKHGFYIVGNATLLTSKSAVWREIMQYLESSGQCGRTLALESTVDSSRVTEVRRAEDFAAVHALHEQLAVELVDVE